MKLMKELKEINKAKKGDTNADKQDSIVKSM